MNGDGRADALAVAPMAPFKRRRTHLPYEG